MLLYLWPSGPKPQGQAALSLPSSDDSPVQNYENVEVLNRHVAEDDEQVICMNTNDPEKHDNQPVSHILASQDLILVKSPQLGNNIENGRLIHLIACLY